MQKRFSNASRMSTYLAKMKGFLTFIITRNTIHWQLHLSALARLSTWTTFSIASIVIGPTLKPFRFNEISSIAHIASVSLG